ncbi:MULTISPECIES: oligopeptide ABC transporter substrate-binding protein [Peptoniphilus]|uniref:oligopeptide ABC transporter substrate-binding protein n=1 Tax=Peptoniphilus TaxID=162289 RepID=UPI0002DA14F2|nr:MULTISPECIES: oligopeptide ABC transporter substrate-binding protein [Peptoniphilus]
MKKNIAKLAGIMACALLFTACGDVSGGGGSSKEPTDVKQTTSAIEEKYPALVENEGEPVEGATLKVAIVSDSPFKGVFNGFLYTDAIDDNFMKYTMDGAFPVDGDFKLITNSDETPINLSFDEAEKTVTYKINPNFKWSNGEQVTTADIVKTYEIVANQDYITAAQSARFDESMEKIVGIVDYNQKKADKISGLEVIDDSTMKIHLTEITPSVLWGGCFCGEFVNAKQFEGVAMDKIIESPALRKNPLSYGPYFIKDMVSGEKVIFEANPYYYKGEPKIKNLEMEILPPSQQVAAIKAGKYDLVFGTNVDVFPELIELDNINVATRMDLYMSYLGFKLGTWDAAKGEVVVNPEAKMADPNLRKAMGYAIDNDALGEQYYHGLRFTAASPIPPLFATLHDPEITGYKLDLEKAKTLLDEAGFKDVNGDDIREDKNGNPLKINLAMMSGSEIQEPLSQYYMQQWKSIGLDVELVDGRLLDFHNFYDRLEADDEGIDCYMAAFGLASDPDQIGLFGKKAPFNMARYTSDELQAAVEKLGSAEAMDDAKRVELYHNFEKVFTNEVPIIPQMNRVDILPINKRVKMYDWRWDDSETGFTWAKIELVANEPIASGN